MINNILDEIWGVRAEPCGLRRDEPNWREVCFQVNVSIYRIKMLVQRPWSRFINELATEKRFGLWTWEWITAEEAERRANDGDPILEPVPHYDFFETVSGSHYSYRICFYRYVPIRFSQRSKENLFGSRDLLAWVWNSFFSSWLSLSKHSSK